jgi:hypothetical protein
MSDELLIREIISQNKVRYGSGVKDSEAFEIFTAESILKRFGLTFDQVEAGIVDGKDYGGIDSAYFFVNRSRPTGQASKSWRPNSRPSAST